MLVHLHSEQGHLVQKRVKRAQRAQPLAERTVKQHAQHDHCDQYSELPGKECTQSRPYPGIDRGVRYRAFQNALRTQILAKERIPHAHIVGDEYRKQDHHDQKDNVFDVGQRLQLACGELSCRYPVEQLLKPSEGAQESADKASQQYADQDEKSGDIIGKPEFRRAHHRLKRSDGAGAGCRRAGVAVQSRHTYGFPFSLVDTTLQKVREMNVGKQCRARLDPAAKARQDVRYARLLLRGFHFFCLPRSFPIQCPHTPNINGSPCSARWQLPRAKHHSPASPHRRQAV